jgi:(+)-trans-carveol dehydrogenase
VSYPIATPQELAETVKEVKALGRRIVAAQADVRDYDALKQVLDDGVAELGRLDIVSANAGIDTHGPLAELPEQAWRDVIDVNLTGVWHTAKAAIPHLRASVRGGSIVLTSSAAGLKALQNSGHYVAAKHDVIGLMRTLALELAPDFIRVNVLAPTVVNTPMALNPAIYRLFRPDLENPTADDMAGPALALNVLPIPWVEPVDISNALLFLASDEARYITGVALPVDAGMVISEPQGTRRRMKVRSGTRWPGPFRDRRGATALGCRAHAGAQALISIAWIKSQSGPEIRDPARAYGARSDPRPASG